MIIENTSPRPRIAMMNVKMPEKSPKRLEISPMVELTKSVGTVICMIFSALSAESVVRIGEKRF